MRKFIEVRSMSSAATSVILIKHLLVHRPTPSFQVRAVQRVKCGLRQTRGILENRLYTLLASHRVTPLGKRLWSFCSKHHHQHGLICYDHQYMTNCYRKKRATNPDRYDTHSATRTVVTGDSACLSSAAGGGVVACDGAVLLHDRTTSIHPECRNSVVRFATCV